MTVAVVALLDEIRVKETAITGAVEFRGIRFGMGRAHAEQIDVVDSGPAVTIFDLKGTLLVEHPCPRPTSSTSAMGADAARHGVYRDFLC